MMAIQFYRNKYIYPDYIPTVAAVGSEVSCTPVNFGSRTGSIKVSRQYLDMESVNYMRFKRDGGRTFWAWIETVDVAGENMFLVSYTVDAWRTYKDVINLDSQFVTRSPVATILRDPLLASTQPYPDVSVKTFAFQKVLWRTMVVQTRVMEDGLLLYSRTPVQPTPYQFYLIDYELNNWTATAALTNLMQELSSGAETQNIVTMYSIPYMNTSALTTSPLPIYVAGTDEPVYISGFKILTQTPDPSGLLYVVEPITFDVDRDQMMRVPHSVQLVIPDAGVMNVPDELLYKPGLALRQDVDLYSGASNYMLVSDGEQYYTSSVRGASITSIPIISDPYDTYMSQNQNALTTSLLGDVASVAGGIGLAVSTGGIGAAAGGGMIASGLTGLAGTYAQNKDAGAQYSNPPAFLGTALAGRFSQSFWMVVTKQSIQNEGLVHAENGYPLNMMTALEFPWAGGYIETKGCAVHSNDGTVPRWAIQEINQMFDAGVEVQTS